MTFVAHDCACRLRLAKCALGIWALPPTFRQCVHASGCPISEAPGLWFQTLDYNRQNYCWNSTRAKFSSVLFDGLCLPPCLKCKLCCKRLSLTRPYCCSLHTAPVQPLPPAPSSSPPRKRTPRTHMTSRSFGGSSTRVQPHLHGEILSQGTRECVLRIDHTSKSCPLYPRLHLAE